MMNTLFMYIVTVNNLHSSSFQPIIHDHTHQYNNHMGESRVSIIPTSIESLPHMSFLDHPSPCIFGKPGEVMLLMFIREIDRTQQLLESLLLRPLAPNHLFSTLEAELTNLDAIKTTSKPFISATTQLLKKEPSFIGVLVSNKCRRGLLPFFRDALSWLTGTATTMYVSNIKKRVNQLITTQYNQQETLVHVISILNVARYVTQVNRQHISIVMIAAEKTQQDVTTFYTIYCTAA